MGPVCDEVGDADVLDADVEADAGVLAVFVPVFVPQDNTGFFTLPNNQLIWVKSTAQGVYTVVYTKVHHSPLTLLPTT